MPYFLESCPLCLQRLPDVAHVLSRCPGTESIYQSVLGTSAAAFGWRGSGSFIFHLFKEAASEELWGMQLRYVGSCVALAVGRLNVHPLNPAGSVPEPTDQVESLTTDSE